MKIAVTYDNGTIFQHFGRTENFKVYEIEDGKVVSSEVIGSNGIGHGALAGLLSDQDIQVLICGGLGGGAMNALQSAGIEVVAGASGSADEAVDAWKNAMPKLRRTDVYLTAKVLWNGEDRAAATLINSRLSHSHDDSAPFNVIFLAERINGEWYIEKASVSDEYLTGTNDIPYDILLQVYRENKRLHPLTEEDIQAAATRAMDAVTGTAFTTQLTEEEKQLLRENLTFSYDPSWSDKATVRNQLAVEGWKHTNAPTQFLDIPALVVWVRPTAAFIGEHPDIADRYLGTWNGYYVYCCFLKEAYTWETGQVTEAGWYAEYPYFSSLPSFQDPDMPHNQVPDRPKEETQGVEVSFGEDDALQEDLKVTVTL